VPFGARPLKLFPMRCLSHVTRIGVLAALAFVPARLDAQKRPVTQPLLTASVTGQTVPLLPLTMVVAEPSVPDTLLRGGRLVLVHFADSLVTEGLLTYAPDIQWIPPAELRRIARRSGGLVPEPDRMGQAVMRTWSLTTVPDPLRSNLRRLVSVAGGGRYAFIPASLILRADSAGVHGDLSVLLADTRTGRVVWRSLAKGTGDSPAAAIAGAVATIFPPDGD
jgi:hypothetical protein